MKQRNSGLDAIRILLTALVVMHHTAITYGGSGGWYWREEADASQTGLVVFNAINQSFFMGFFFLLAGYFSAMSILNKGWRIFLTDRVLRLGLPLLVYFTCLHPLTVALANAKGVGEMWPIILYLWQEFLLEPGPLWFAEALLIFSALLFVLGKIYPLEKLKNYTIPSFGILFSIMLALGLINFLVRLVVPIGVNVFWLQLAYFPCYVFLFFAGVMAWKGRALEAVCFRHTMPWLLVGLFALLIIPVALSGVFGTGDTSGGVNLNAFVISMWEPLIGTSIILLLLNVSQHWFGRPREWLNFLARRAFIIFIIHPPIVVSMSLLMSGLDFLPLVKFLIVSAASLMLCVLIGSLLLYIPPVRKIV